MTYRRSSPLAVVTAAALAVPPAAFAQGVGDDAAAGLDGCYALEVGEWTVDWDPGPVPSRFELLSRPFPGPPASAPAEANGGSKREARGARAVDGRGDSLGGFDAWTSLGLVGFRLSGGPHARIDLLFVRREGAGYRGFAVPRRPEMDASRSGRRPQAPVAARPVPCDP